jgi:tetratricopeptide (TPR) repeat protein
VDLLRSGDATAAAERFRLALGAVDDAEVRGPAGVHLRGALHNNLGLTLVARDSAVAAAEAFDEAGRWIAQDSVRALRLYNAGTAMAMAERWEDAVDRLTQALILRPDSEAARHNLEIVLRRLNAAAPPESGRPPEPSEFARRLKAEAERLVGERRYSEALSRMQDGLRRDSTVAAFNDFIGRLGDVVGILSADTSAADGR